MLRIEDHHSYLSKITHSKNSCIQPAVITFGYDCFMKKQQHVHCPYCNRTMLTTDEINEFANTVKHMRGQKAIDEIRLKTKELKPFSSEKIVAKKLISKIQQNPELSVDNIIKNMATEYEPALLKTQINIFNKAYEQSEELPKDLKKIAQNIIPKTNINFLLDMQPKTKQALLKRKTLLNEMYALKNSIDDNTKNVDTVSKIIDTLGSLPRAKISPNAFIVKYGNRSSTSFLSFLLEPLQSTADHIYTRDSVGSPGTWNYLSVCRDCNTERSNTPLQKWVEEHPKFYKAFPQYIIDYTHAIAKLGDKEVQEEGMKKVISTVLRALNKQPIKIYPNENNFY